MLRTADVRVQGAHMGRNYREELGELHTTSTRPMVQQTELSRAVAASGDLPLLVVASGGAQIAARWLAQLHMRAFGQPATVLTPLEAMNAGNARGAAIWLVSQGGGHADIMSAGSWAMSHRPTDTYALIGRESTPLAILIDEGGGLSCSIGVPAGADGFLSTNGLWAMLTSLTGAYLPHLSRIGDAGIDSVGTAQAVLAWAKANVGGIPDEAFRDEIAIVADPWTLLGAADMQVRATEASLANVWVSDYRNLGHGRHFWFADRIDSTTCLFMSSDEFRPLDEWTRRGLPENLLTLVVDVPFQGVAAALASVAWSMYWADRQAAFKDRDPGRPGVPSFGERLYDGGFRHEPMVPSVSANDAAVAKKLNRPLGVGVTNTDPTWLDALRAYKQALAQRRLRAVVFDFDGTLIFSQHRWGDVPDVVAHQLMRLNAAGVIIGIATGRGDSIQPVLRRALNGGDLSRVIVGYHHGSTVCALSEAVSNLDGACDDGALKHAYDLLLSRLKYVATSDLRRRQCTLRSVNGTPLKDIWLLARDVLDSDPRTAGLSVWLSSHSIDICSCQSSKLNVVAHIAREFGFHEDEVLRLGDRGTWPGNDFELLDHPNGVSVDTCSLAQDRCWNITSHVGPGPLGVERLLSAAKIVGDGVVQLDMEKLE